MPKYMTTWIFKTHISFTFNCPMFPVLLLKSPNLVFHYFPSILSMHKHACYVHHLIFCKYATHSFYQVVGHIFKILTLSPSPDGKLVLPRTVSRSVKCVAAQELKFWACSEGLWIWSTEDVGLSSSYTQPFLEVKPSLPPTSLLRDFDI